MSRTGLHRPRHPRAVWDRPATGTRLLPSPFPPNVPPHIPHYKRCPKAHRLRLRSDQSLSLPVHVTGYGRSPDKKRLALSKGSCQVRAPLTRRIRFASSGDAPEHTSCLHLGHSAPSGLPRPRPCSVRTVGPSVKQTHHLGIPPSSPSENSGLRTPVTGPRSHPLGWPGTSGGRDCPTPRFSRVSSTSSQKHGAVAKPASMWNIRCRGKRPSVQASPPSCATVRDLPSASTSPAPSIQGKADSSRKTIRPHAWVRASIKTPPFIPTKGTAQQPIPSTPPPTIK